MKYLYFILSICWILSCSDRELSPTESNPKVEVNQPPSPVKFTIDSISHNGAHLSWEAASDPESDELSYSIELDGKLVLERAKDRTYKFQNLDELTTYSGKIIVTDAHKNTTSTSFSFQTKKFYLTFVKNYLFPGATLTSGAPYNILKLSDGNYLVGGYVSAGTYFYTVFLMKTDYYGNVIWKKNYDIAGESSPFTFIMKEIQGEIILAASYTVAKLNLDGIQKWEKRITTYDNGYGDSTINSFATDADHNIYIAGTLADTTDESAEMGMITKLTPDGQLIWEKKYTSYITETGNKTMYLRFMDIDIKGDQIYILGDIDISGMDTNSNMVKQVFYFLKTDTDGSSLSEKAYNHHNNLSHKILRRKNGNYLLSSQQSIVEIDQSGNEVWAKTYYAITQMYSMFYSFKETASGDLVFVGKEDKLGVYFRTDNRGNMLYKKYYNSLPNYAAGIDVVLEDDQSYRIAFAFGRYYSFNLWYDEIMLVKTDTEGNYK